MSLGLPYRIFGFDSAMTDVVHYAQAADRWMKNGGREMLARKLGIAAHERRIDAAAFGSAMTTLCEDSVFGGCDEQSG